MMRWLRRWWWLPVVFGLLGQASPEGCEEAKEMGRDFRRDPVLPALPLNPDMRALTPDVLYLYPDDNWTMKIAQAYPTTKIVLVGPGTFNLTQDLTIGTPGSRRQIFGQNNPVISADPMDIPVVTPSIILSGTNRPGEGIFDGIDFSIARLQVTGDWWNVRGCTMTANPGWLSGTPLVVTGRHGTVEGCVYEYTPEGGAAGTGLDATTALYFRLVNNDFSAYATAVEYTVLNGTVQAGNVGVVVAH